MLKTVKSKNETKEFEVRYFYTKNNENREGILRTKRQLSKEKIQKKIRKILKTDNFRIEGGSF